MTESQDNERSTENEKTARLAGAGAGVLAGAQLGTVLVPVPVVGTFTGALVGDLGTRVGKKIGGAILEKFDSAQSSQTCQTSQASQAAPGRPDVMAELERLGKMRADGLIDEDEFKAAKAKILGL
ncbi:MAG: SHOCT domain-containing protein [Cyanobacteriota/Melainabacteria group bacterium]